MGLVRDGFTQARALAHTWHAWSWPELLGLLRLPLHLAGRSGSAPGPLALGHYLTLRCVENCTFCNVTGVLGKDRPELSSEDLLRLADRLVPRIPIVMVGGGEPLVHPGAFDYMARIRRNGGRVLLVTCGTLLDSARAARLAAIGPDVVSFSLLGDEPTHDLLMGHVGSWNACLAGIGRFMAARDPRTSRVIVNCALGPENWRNMDTVVALARETGVDRVRFTWLSFLSASERRAERRDVTYLVLPEVPVLPIRELLARIEALEKAWPDFVSFGPSLGRHERERWFTEGGGVRRRCFSLYHSLFLRSDGQAVPCGHFYEHPLGSLLHQDIDEVWNSPRCRAFRKAQWNEPYAVCRRCCKI